ncbi:hypothetical protein GCM10009838_39260 [Catenulispora subtropica]|uniref:Flp pilus-assembly TadG-like N-terminal domain-containing protein n=2 Tax=Catenulispora subtropica TaxID=450798 RepID=A0ABP5D7P1_9ACTN
MLSRLRGLQADAGAITIVTVILGGMMLAFIGFVWDGGRGVGSVQTADDLAAEAGRTAAQCVSVSTFLIKGTAVIPNPTKAMTCAQPYADLVNAAGNGYTMTLTDITLSPTRDSLSVTVEVDRPVAFLSAFGFDGKYIGHATVKLTQGVTDAGG